jgi:hypothetical protein
MNSSTSNQTDSSQPSTELEMVQITNSTRTLINMQSSLNPSLNTQDGNRSIKKVRKNELGNATIASSAIRREQRAENKKRTLGAYIGINQDELLKIYDKCTNCCQLSKDSNIGTGGCVKRAFMTFNSSTSQTTADLIKSLELISRARDERCNLSGPQFDNFIQEKWRSCFLRWEGDGKKQAVMNWHFEGHILCRESFGQIFGISKYKLDLCSSTLKNAPTNRVTSLNVREYKDDHIHELTYSETEQLIKDNLSTGIVGESL